MVKNKNRKKNGALKLVLQACLNGILCVVLFGIPLFLPAGSLEFWKGWLFLAIFVVCFMAILIYLAILNPEFAEKRMQKSETESPQKVIMLLLVLSALSTFVVAGFDFHFHWSKVPMIFTAVFSAVMIAGFFMLFRVMLQNSFASRVIEIQKKQKLINTGMYGMVRHPMYLAFVVIFLAAPVVLGSWYAFIPVILIPVLIGFRIDNEEKVLKKGLKGYDQYIQKVKKRLIPFIW